MDLSLIPLFSTLTGFTTEEVRENFMDVFNVYCEKDYIEEELKDIKFHYNGYRFSNLITENSVFSPYAVIQHLISMLDIFLYRKEKKNAKNKGTFFH